jgi:hypothetical protein
LQCFSSGLKTLDLRFLTSEEKERKGGEERRREEPKTRPLK